MILILLLSLALSKPSVGLQLIVIPEKQIFQRAEAVTVSLKLKNNGDVPLLVDSRLLPTPDETFGGELTILLTGPGERPVPCVALSEPSPLSSMDVQLLAPGQSLTKPLSISGAFALTDSGTYLLQAVYDTSKMSAPSLKPQGTLSFWHGKIVSAPITFEIENDKK